MNIVLGSPVAKGIPCHGAEDMKALLQKNPDVNFLKVVTRIKGTKYKLIALVENGAITHVCHVGGGAFVPTDDDLKEILSWYVVDLYVATPSEVEKFKQEHGECKLEKPLIVLPTAQRTETAEAEGGTTAVPEEIEEDVTKALDYVRQKVKVISPREDIKKVIESHSQEIWDMITKFGSAKKVEIKVDEKDIMGMDMYVVMGEVVGFNGDSKKLFKELKGYFRTITRKLNKELGVRVEVGRIRIA
jgi:hypothetical protein